MTKKIIPSEFFEKCSRVHNGKFTYHDDYVSMKTKIRITCPIHGDFWQEPRHHINGHSCPYCSHKSTRYTNEEFFKKCREVHEEKYTYHDDYDGRNKKIRITCPIHGDFWQRADAHMTGAGCPKCANKNNGESKALGKNAFIEKAKIVHGEKYDYSKVKYVNNSTKVCIICPEHGEFWQTPNKHLNGCGCQMCNESHLEVQIRKMLTNSGISFTPQFNDKWLGRQELDFYLPDYNVAIECQGGQHFEPIDFFGGEEGFKTRQELDLRKHNLCKENGIRLLYFSNIKEDLFLGERVIHDENELLVGIKEGNA